MKNKGRKERDKNGNKHTERGWLRAGEAGTHERHVHIHSSLLGLLNSFRNVFFNFCEILR